MKKILKAFSLVMVLVMMLSVVCLPASAKTASDAKVSFDLSLAPVVGETDVNGAKSEENGIYKLTVYLTSNVRLYCIIMDIVFDNTKFAPLDAANDYQYTTDLEYNEPLYNRLGTMLDANGYDASGNVASRVKYFGPSHTKASTYEFKFTQTKENALLWNYEPCDNALELGECTNEPVAEIYFKLLDGQSAEGAVFGFGTGEGVSAKDVTFDDTPAAGKFHVMATANYVAILPRASVGTPNYTYTSSVAEESILKPMSSQIRFKGVGSDGDFTNYGGTFDVRTRATIAKADFNAKFTDEATALAGITEFGFIYKHESDGAFDYETAKKVADGTSSDATYAKAICHYMQRTADGYNFTCLITGIADAEHNDKVNCIAYVCFNGEYIFFDAPASADYNALYTAWKK